MQFVLNNKLVSLTGGAPDTSLLRYLRSEQQLVGTKEACASGDCGACTVLVGRHTAQGIAYKAVNSCIFPLGSLHNHSVITIEGLSNLSSGQLHPVQQSMVKCHASQCGFCTPGFVMSLVGLHHSLAPQPVSELQQALVPQQPPEPQLRAEVTEAISGNLCRCTGYRPIVDAAIQALQQPAPELIKVQQWQAAAPLTGNLALEQADHSYWQPESEAQLQSLLKLYPDARLIAGGTDLMLEVSQHYKTLPRLIDLKAIPSLTAIAIDATQIALGAAASYCELETALADIAPEFVKFLSRLGSRQIRNSGTLGGNICNASPIADCPPWLLVLEAELLIGNNRGEYRRELLSDFYRDYKCTSLATGEYLAQVIIQTEALAQPLSLFKISKRYEDDISAVMGAFRRDHQGQFFIAFGGMAAIPKRARATEAFLTEHTHALSDKVIARACRILSGEFSPLSDVRASAEYRMAMACNLLKKACHEFTSGESFPGVFDHA